MFYQRFFDGYGGKQSLQSITNGNNNSNGGLIFLSLRTKISKYFFVRKSNTIMDNGGNNGRDMDGFLKRYNNGGVIMKGDELLYTINHEHEKHTRTAFCSYKLTVGMNRYWCLTRFTFDGKEITETVSDDDNDLSFNLLQTPVESVRGRTAVPNRPRESVRQMWMSLTGGNIDIYAYVDPRYRNNNKFNKNGKNNGGGSSSSSRSGSGDSDSDDDHNKRMATNSANNTFRNNNNNNNNNLMNDSNDIKNNDNTNNSNNKNVSNKKCNTKNNNMRNNGDNVTNDNNNKNMNDSNNNNDIDNNNNNDNDGDNDKYNNRKNDNDNNNDKDNSNNNDNKNSNNNDNEIKNDDDNNIDNRSMRNNNDHNYNIHDGNTNNDNNKNINDYYVSIPENSREMVRGNAGVSRADNVADAPVDHVAAAPVDKGSSSQENILSGRPDMEMATVKMNIYKMLGETGGVPHIVFTENPMNYIRYTDIPFYDIDENLLSIDWTSRQMQYANVPGRFITRGDEVQLQERLSSSSLPYYGLIMEIYPRLCAIRVQIRSRLTGFVIVYDNNDKAYPCFTLLQTKEEFEKTGKSMLFFRSQYDREHLQTVIDEYRGSAPLGIHSRSSTRRQHENCQTGTNSHARQWKAPAGLKRGDENIMNVETMPTLKSLSIFAAEAPGWRTESSEKLKSKMNEHLKSAQMPKSSFMSSSDIPTSPVRKRKTVGFETKKIFEAKERYA